MKLFYKYIFLWHVLHISTICIIIYIIILTCFLLPYTYHLFTYFYNYIFLYFKYFVSTTEISLLVFTVCSFLKCLLRLKFSVIIFLILFFKHVRAPRAPEVTKKLYYTAKSRHPRPTRTHPSKTRKRRGRKAKHPLLPTAKLQTGRRKI